MRRKRGASQFIGLNRHRVIRDRSESRLAERDRRQAADTEPKRRNFSAIHRLIGQRWHGVPHRHRAGVQARGNELICGDGDLSKK